MPRHVEELFSGAYDKQLDSSARDRFDAHLAVCEQCRKDFAQFVAGIEALRALPPAAMPTHVHLPSSPPLAASDPWWRRLLAMPASIRVGLPTALAAAAAAILLALNAHPAASPSALQEHRALDATSGNSAGNLAAPKAMGAQAPAQACVPVPIAGAPGSTLPSGFSNFAARTDMSRPQQELLIATKQSRVAAGSTVVVYARFQSPQAVVGSPGASSTPPMQQALPCLTLRGAAGATLTQLQPATHVTADGVVAQTVVIPSGLPPGTTLQLVAQVPAGVPNSDAAAIEAVLTLTVE